MLGNNCQRVKMKVGGGDGNSSLAEIGWEGIKNIWLDFALTWRSSVIAELSSGCALCLLFLEYSADL